MIGKYRKWLKWESLEQALFVEWLEINWYKFTAIPNSTYTKSIKQHLMNKILWVNPWLCDMLIILKRKSLLFIEMKKERWIKWGMNGSVISPEQTEWVNALDDIPNVSACFAHWCKDAIKIILEMESK